MAKKVGIVTFHHALSYGAVLQAYALQNFLFDLGCDNEIVNYRCKFIENNTKLFNYKKGKSLKEYASAVYFHRNVTKNKKNSYLFGKKFFKQSVPYTRENISKSSDQYDMFIAGSDQVWSPTCVGCDPTYFLDFAKPEQKYSYAASFGTNKIPDNRINDYKSMLKDFQSFSVREKSGQTLVNDLAGKDAIVNIDPTLLLEKERWDKIEEKVIDEPYIFLFTVLKPKKLISYALNLAKEKGLKVYYLNKRHNIKDPNLEYLDPITADKFIGLIKNAEYVCTNSFHGNSFSIIYNKNFVVETETTSKENIRSKELMQELGLENRILSQDHTPNIDIDTDWGNVEKILSEKRKKSESYLRTIIEK